jgi:hypothetical protein
VRSGAHWLAAVRPNSILFSLINEVLGKAVVDAPAVYLPAIRIPLVRASASLAAFIQRQRRRFCDKHAMASQFLGRSADAGSRDELYGRERMTLRLCLGSRP